MCHVVAAILDFQFDPQKIYFKSDIWGTFLWFNNSIEHGFWEDFLKLFQPSKHYWTSSHVDNQPITFLPSLFPFAQLFSEKKKLKCENSIDTKWWHYHASTFASCEIKPTVYDSLHLFQIFPGFIHKRCLCSYMESCIFDTAGWNQGHFYHTFNHLP